MNRTTVMIPSDLKKRALRRARETGISLGEFVRRSLIAALKTPDKQRRKNDPLFSDSAVYRGPVPPDLSANHDSYLYDEEVTDG